MPVLTAIEIGANTRNLVSGLLVFFVLAPVLFWEKAGNANLQMHVLRLQNGRCLFDGPVASSHRLGKGRLLRPEVQCNRG